MANCFWVDRIKVECETTEVVTVTAKDISGYAYIKTVGTYQGLSDGNGNTVNSIGYGLIPDGNGFYTTWGDVDSLAEGVRVNGADGSWNPVVNAEWVRTTGSRMICGNKDFQFTTGYIDGQNYTSNGFNVEIFGTSLANTTMTVSYPGAVVTGALIDQSATYLTGAHSHGYSYVGSAQTNANQSEDIVNVNVGSGATDFSVNVFDMLATAGLPSTDGSIYIDSFTFSEDGHHLLMYLAVFGNTTLPSKGAYAFALSSPGDVRTVVANTGFVVGIGGNIDGIAFTPTEDGFVILQSNAIYEFG